MAQSSSYSKSSIEDSDIFFGSKFSTNRTVNYAASAITQYLNYNAKISIAGQMSYEFLTSTYGAGSMFFAGGGGNNTPFSSITEILVSKNDLKNIPANVFLNYLITSNIIIAKQSEHDVFGHYKITNFEADTVPDFYVLTLSFIGGNGSLQSESIYEVANFVLAKDVSSATWGNITGDILDQTDLIDYIASASLNTTFQQVTDAGNTTTNDVYFNSDFYTDSSVIIGANDPNGGYAQFKKLGMDAAETNINAYGISTPIININSLTSGQSAAINSDDLTNTRNFQLPDNSGTIALVSDIPTLTSELTNDSGFLTIGTLPVDTLQQAYNVSTIPQITTSTSNYFAIRSGRTLNSETVFVIRDNTGIEQFGITGGGDVSAGYVTALRVLTGYVQAVGLMSYGGQFYATPTESLGGIDKKIALEFIPIDVSFTALQGVSYAANGTLTVTDPTPVTNKGYIIHVVGGTTTINGVGYTAGSLVYRFYNGATWSSKDYGAATGTVTSVSGTTNRITSTGGTTPVIDISASYVGQTSITTLGTIGTGTWNATAITDTYISSASVWNAKQSALSGTGIVKSTAGVISYLTDNTSNWDSAFTNRITSLTVTGSSGASTLIANVLNIPTYTLSGLGGASTAYVDAADALKLNIASPSYTGLMTGVGTTQTSSSAIGVLDLSQTWNTSGNPTALNLNITNTASGATSKLFDFQLGGTSLLKLDKAGILTGIGTSSSGISTPWLVSGGTGTSAGGLKLGAYDASNGGIWSGAVTPSSTNHALLASSTITTLNANTFIDVTTQGFQVARFGISNTTFTAFGLTGSGATNAFTFNQTWNTTGNPTAIIANITNTASGASANLMDLQVGGVSQFKVSKAGTTTITGNLVASAVVGSASNTAFTGFTLALNGGTPSAATYLAINGSNSATTGASFGQNSVFSFTPTSGTATATAIGWSGTINQTGGANGITRGLYINPTLTAAADFRAIDVTAGKLMFSSTITAPGTTGAQTINKISGKVNAAAGTTSLVVTNNLVTANSIVICQMGTNDATARITSSVEAAGSFTINYVAPTAETVIKFFVIN